MRFYAEHADISYGKTRIVEELSLEIPEGKITALIGANGSGKSTVLKALCRIMKPDRGQVILDGRSIHRMGSKELARRLAILPQGPEAPEGLTVEELTAYGRSPYRTGYGRLSTEDREKIRWALSVTQMEEFAGRSLEQLSGGQRQRAWIAMCLAQDTEILFLDEPTTYLDISYQLDIMKLLKHLNVTYQKTIVMVVHDLNHASLFADHIVAVKKGKIVNAGRPESVITSLTCRTVFGVMADVFPDPRTKRPLCIPYDHIIDEETNEIEKRGYHR